MIVKGALYPLIGAMYLASGLFSLGKGYPEFAVLLSGLFASAFIGSFYLGLPVALVRARFRRSRTPETQRTLQRALAFILLGSLIGLLIGEVAASAWLLMASTSTVVLATIFLFATFTSYRVANRLSA
jgi:hypothetical protein